MRMILYANANGILGKDDDGTLVSVCVVSLGYWTLKGTSGESTLVRVGGCAPLLGNDVLYLNQQCECMMPCEKVNRLPVLPFTEELVVEAVG